MDHPESAVHRVSCGALIREGRILLAHRSPEKAWYPNVWGLPGGHLELGETSAEALVRELHEELGIKVAVPAGAALTTIRTTELILDVWLIHEWDGALVNAAPDEHDAIGWFTADEVTTLALADDKYAILFAQILG